MNLEQLQGYDRALKALEANRSPRYREIDRLERFVATTQYLDRPSWWNNDCDKPLWERAPCIAYPIVKSAISANVDLIFGEGRFPQIAFDRKTVGEQADALNSELALLLKQARFRTVSRQFLAQAQGCRSAVALLGARNGRLVIETTKAKWCEPEFGDDGSVKSLEIRYPYLDRYQLPNGTWAVRALIYRRVIDEQSDTLYKPAEALESGAEPKWQVANKAEHKLGFCPVIWYAHLKGPTAVNVYDGEAVHEHCLDEIEAHDMAISQRHRAALYLGEPQLVEIGVPPGYSPTEVGRMPDVPAAAGPSFNVEGNPGRRLSGFYEGFVGAGSGKQGRKKGPGYTWQYPNADVKVELLSLDPGALKALDEHAHDLKVKIAESLCVVFLDPEGVKFASTTSGKALRALKQRQLDRCDQIRDDLTDCYLEPIIRMAIRVAVEANLPVIAKSAAKFSELISDELRQSLSVTWGEYFEPDADDDKAIVDTVVNAVDYLDDETAIRKLRPVFDIEDVEAYLERLKKHREEKQAQALEQVAGEAEALHSAAAMNADPGANRAGRGANAKANAGRGGKPAAPAKQPSE
jgi:hypothetical protein